MKNFSYDGRLDAAELNRHGATHILKREIAKMDKSRKVNVGSQQETMEKELMSVLTDMRKENYHINRTIIFMNVLKICPNFKGSVHSHNFMSQMKNWVYYGFNKQYNLSYKRISGASINLPPN